MNETLNINAMKLAMAAQMKTQILGIFGPENEAECTAKLHSIVELAETLKIKNITVSVSLEELVAAKNEFIKSMKVEDDE